MVKYIFKRIGYMITVFFVVSFLMYCVYNLIPGDPAAQQLEEQKSKMTPEAYLAAYTALRDSMGLDDPIVVRYARWMGFAKNPDGSFSGLLEGDFGYSSYFKNDVIAVIPRSMSNTVMLNIFSTIIALAITIPLGIYCAVHKKGKADQVTQVVTIVGYSIPIYIVALLCIWLFAVTLHLFPVTGAKTPGSNYTGMKEFLDRLYYMCLPVIVMTLASLGGMTRYVRAAMIESLGMDCIRTARAKGLKEKVVIYSHAWRNALLPIITTIIGWFLGIFGGSVIIENTFGLNGMGALYYVGLNNQDYELALAIQMFYMVVSLVGTLITDLSYGLVDPRVHVDK